MTTPIGRQQRGFSSQRTVLPKKKTIGWPRCYACHQKKRGWWETIRQLLF